MFTDTPTVAPESHPSTDDSSLQRQFSPALWTGAAVLVQGVLVLSVSFPNTRKAAQKGWRGSKEQRQSWEPKIPECQRTAMPTHP